MERKKKLVWRAVGDCIIVCTGGALYNALWRQLHKIDHEQSVPNAIGYAISK